MQQRASPHGFMAALRLGYATPENTSQLGPAMQIRQMPRARQTGGLAPWVAQEEDLQEGLDYIISHLERKSGAAGMDDNVLTLRA